MMRRKNVWAAFGQWAIGSRYRSTRSCLLEPAIDQTYRQIHRQAHHTNAPLPINPNTQTPMQMPKTNTHGALCAFTAAIFALLSMVLPMTHPAHAEPANNTIVLENFSSLSGSAANASSFPQDRWEFIADTVMGGVSTGNVQFVTDNGQTILKLSGTVSTANNGGFIQARLPLDQTSTNPLPETAQGIWLKARGNGQKYFVHVRTSGTVLPWQYYQAAFETTDQWQEIKLSWDDFKPSGGLSGSLLRDVPLANKVKSIAIVAFGRDHEADVEVAEIGYY